MSNSKPRNPVRTTVRTGRAPPSAGSIPMRNELDAPCKFINVGGPHGSVGCENTSSSCRRTHRLLTPFEWVAWFPEHDMRDHTDRLLSAYRLTVDDLSDQDKFDEYVSELTNEVEEQLFKGNFKGLDREAWESRVKEANDTGGDPRYPPRPPSRSTFSRSPEHRNYVPDNEYRKFERTHTPSYTQLSSDMRQDGSVNSNLAKLEGSEYPPLSDHNVIEETDTVDEIPPTYATVVRNSLDSTPVPAEDSSNEDEKSVKSEPKPEPKAIKMSWADDIVDDDIDDDSDDDNGSKSESAPSHNGVDKNAALRISSRKQLVKKRVYTTDDKPGTIHQKDLDALNNNNGVVQKSQMAGMLEFYMQTLMQKERRIIDKQEELEERELKIKRKEAQLKRREEELDKQLQQLQQLQQQQMIDMN